MFYTGVDFGGTKIEAVPLDDSGTELSRLRVLNPGHYEGTLNVMIELINAVETRSAERLGQSCMQAFPLDRPVVRTILLVRGNGAAPVLALCPQPRQKPKRQ